MADWMVQEEREQLGLIRKYIDRYYREPEIVSYKAEDRAEIKPQEFREPEVRYSPVEDLTLLDILESRSLELNLEKTFSERMRELMGELSLSAPEVYKRGNLEKSLFSKLQNDPYYCPSKDTAIQIAFGLGLDLKSAKDLIGRAGFRLSHSIMRDVALECCFKSGFMDVVRINILLDELGLQPLGRQGR